MAKIRIINQLQTIRMVLVALVTCLMSPVTTANTDSSITCYDKQCPGDNKIYCDLEYNHCRLDQYGVQRCKSGGTQRGMECQGSCSYDYDWRAYCDQARDPSILIYIIAVVVIVVAIVGVIVTICVTWKCSQHLRRRRRRGEVEPASGQVTVQQTITLPPNNTTQKVPPHYPSYAYGPEAPDNTTQNVPPHYPSYAYGPGAPIYNTAPPPYQAPPRYPSPTRKPAGWNPNPAKLSTKVPSAPLPPENSTTPPYLGV